MGRTLPDVLPERHFGESAETRRKSFTAGGASSREVRAEKTGRSVAPTRRLASLRAAVSPKSRLSVAQGETGCRRSPLKSGPKLNFEAASLKSSSESSRRSAETFSDGGKLAPGRSKFLSMARSFRAARETRGGSVEVSEQLRSFPATAGSSRRVLRDFFHRREVSEQLAKLAAGRAKFPSSSEVSRRRREARVGSVEVPAKRARRVGDASSLGAGAPLEVALASDPLDQTLDGAIGEGAECRHLPPPIPDRLLDCRVRGRREELRARQIGRLNARALRSVAFA